MNEFKNGDRVKIMCSGNEYKGFFIGEMPEMDGKSVVTIGRGEARALFTVATSQIKKDEE